MSVCIYNAIMHWLYARCNMHVYAVPVNYVPHTMNPSSRFALGIGVCTYIRVRGLMYYILPLDPRIDWPAVKHSLALIMLQMVFAFQTNIDQCTPPTRDKNACTHWEWLKKWVTVEVGWRETPTAVYEEHQGLCWVKLYWSPVRKSWISILFMFWRVKSKKPLKMDKVAVKLQLPLKYCLQRSC